MSSYTLMAKLSNIESATTDIEDSITGLKTNKQDKLTIAGSGVNSYPLMTNSNVIKGFQADFPFTMTNNTDTNVLARFQNGLNRGHSAYFEDNNKP